MIGLLISFDIDIVPIYAFSGHIIITNYNLGDESFIIRWGGWGGGGGLDTFRGCQNFFGVIYWGLEIDNPWRGWGVGFFFFFFFW